MGDVIELNQEGWIIVCPDCGGEDFIVITDIPATQDGWNIIGLVCTGCGIEIDLPAVEDVSHDAVSG